MQKEKIILILSLIIAIILFFYGLTSLFYPNKIKIWHERSLKKSNNILSKYALEQSEKRNSNFRERFTGFGCLIMSILMIWLFLKKLLY